jgi:hypothetical protein
MKKLVLLLCGVVVLGMAAQPAVAASNLGAYVGFALDPDDFLIGVRWTNPLGEEGLYLVPSAEVGFGDVTMIAGNLDLHYRFKSSSSTKFYAGGGMTVNYFDFDGGSDTEFGGSILGGVLLSAMKSGKVPFIEAKFGLGDVPDAKFIVGLNF